jgi:hypothetical protein
MHFLPTQPNLRKKWSEWYGAGKVSGILVIAMTELHVDRTTLPGILVLKCHSGGIPRIDLARDSVASTDREKWQAVSVMDQQSRPGLHDPQDPKARVRDYFQKKNKCIYESGKYLNRAGQPQSIKEAIADAKATGEAYPPDYDFCVNPGSEAGVIEVRPEGTITALLRLLTAESFSTGCAEPR